ncbi:hypothetical protein H5410_045955 [Solanum commersonii]|uniref:Endonuclease/exonuclease/phosphatase domain-containing protein n=1 Tax=Solanum commersonii TaxID=4109 RepID=A0A9J5XAY8_SOLCO|nr:hypothetical protein H5410_045955 [Solanum commersonii]
MVENIDISGHKNSESVNKTKEAVELLYNKAKGIDHSKDFGESSGVQELVEGVMPIQQIHDAESVSIQNPGYHTDGEIEASSWVKSHILELSKTYGVAFEGFREETHVLLMKLDKRKSVMENKGANSAVSTPHHRGIGKNELQNLQSDLNEEETKINKNVEGIAKQLRSSRWMKCGYSEADGSSGGILIIWNSRVWMGSYVEEGKYSITYKFEVVHDGFCWFLTGVYAPHTRAEKLECWEEIAAFRELCGGPWVTCGDFNTVRTMAERRGCRRITNVMADFSSWIEDMELHDPHLNGGTFTWYRGADHDSAARLDMFLYSIEWEVQFRNIRQQIMPRVISDHNPVRLQCGDWEQRKAYFKFENWWLNVEGFKHLVKNWWNGFVVEGCPDFKFSMMLKQKLKDWSGVTFGELNNKKNSLLSELAEMDLIQNDRVLTKDEIMIRETVLVELEELAKNEESRWRQKSKVLWLKQGDNNTKFFQRIATAHRRCNTIDRLIFNGEENKDPKEIKDHITEFYKRYT